MREYIKGYCRTNLDDYKMDDWPEVFVEVPRIGEYVRAKDDMYKELKVVQITHTVNDDNEPIIIVELNR